MNHPCSQPPHRLLGAGLTGALLVATLGACSGSSDQAGASSSLTSTASTSSKPSPTTSRTPNSATSSSSPSPTRTQAQTGLPTDAELAAARRDVEKLTTKQLAGQVVVGFFTGDDAAAAAAAVERDNLGGIILMGDNVPHDVTGGTRAMTKAVQAAMKKTGRDWPAAIGTDQEGGPVTRLDAPLTQLPGAMAYGAANNPTMTTDVAKGMGSELNSIGINMVLAPVADVTVGPADPTIGVRSPSSDPLRTAAAAKAEVSGFQQAGVVPVVKHFPGHGSVTTDTHVDYAVQKQPLSALLKRDWVPFAQTIAAGAPAIMTAHIVLKDVDPNVPSTLSQKVLTGQLRDRLGFKGLIVTDALNMGAIVKKFDQNGAAAVSALKAGADVVLMPQNATQSVAAITRAVSSGELTRDRLVDSAARIVATMRHQQVARPAAQKAGAADEAATALARASITQLGGRCGARLVGSRVTLQGGGAADRAELTKDLRARGVTVGKGGTSVTLIKGGTYNAGSASAAHGSEATRQGGSGEGSTSASGVQVALDTPYVLARRPAGSVGLATYGRTPTTYAVLADILTGRAKAGGTLPVPVGSNAIGTSACH